MGHIHLMRWADLVIVAPATANFINKIAYGLGEDLASTLPLAHDFKKPFLIAPAMNTSMYLHPTTQNSLQQLRKIGYEILESESGVLACGEVGYGRLLEPEVMLKAISDRLNSKKANLNLRVLITSGGTEETIDSVRSITNTSTGQTGAWLVQQLAGYGCQITHVKSQRSLSAQLPATAELQIFEFTDYASLRQILKSQLEQNHFDYVIHLAAVSDYSVDEVLVNGIAQTPSKELKLSSQSELSLKLKKNPKLIESFKSWSRNKAVQVIGFKLTSEADLQQVQQAVKKVFASGADYVVQNDLHDIKEGRRQFRFYRSSEDFLKAENFFDLLQITTRLFSGGFK